MEVRVEMSKGVLEGVCEVDEGVCVVEPPAAGSKGSRLWGRVRNALRRNKVIYEQHRYINNRDKSIFPDSTIVKDVLITLVQLFTCTL